jgi:nucleoside phosphorylase
MKKEKIIVLLMATYIEAKPFVEKIRWIDFVKYPFPVYYGAGLVLVISGMGKTNAAAACSWLCATIGPACIVNLGAAGANCADMPLGGIYHISQTLEIDRRHFRTGQPFCHQPDLMEGFEQARLASRDEPVTDPEERLKVSYIAELSDMEGAAIVQTAEKYQTKIFLFKFISDTPCHTTGNEIAAHIRQFREHSFDFFMTQISPRLP